MIEWAWKSLMIVAERQKITPNQFAKVLGIKRKDANMLISGQCKYSEQELIEFTSKLIMSRLYNGA